MWEDAKNIVYSSFCSKGLEIVIRCREILWGFCNVGKSRVLSCSSVLPGWRQGMGSISHVISSSPLFLPGTLLLLFLPRKEDCKISSFASCFFPLFSGMTYCYPWDNSPVWIGWEMQRLASLTVQSILRDGFQAIREGLFALRDISWDCWEVCWKCSCLLK